LQKLKAFPASGSGDLLILNFTQPITHRAVSASDFETLQWFDSPEFLSAPQEHGRKIRESICICPTNPSSHKDKTY